MKRWIHASAGTDYLMDATFYNQSIYADGIEISAYDLDDAKGVAIDRARNDLEVVNSREIREGTWEVTVGFPGVSNVSKTYRFRADSKDEAEDDAYWRAAHQLDARRYRAKSQIDPIFLKFQYVIYSYDLANQEEVEVVNGFNGSRKAEAIEFAQNYAEEHTAEGLGAHVVIIPDNPRNKEVLEYFEYGLGGVEPYEVVWSSY